MTGGALRRDVALSIVLGVAAASCVLPGYEVSGDQGIMSSNGVDAGSNALEAIVTGADGACGECLASQCSAQRLACGDACKDLKMPISPAMELSTDADALLQCMVEQCDETCNVRWGCVDKYVWPNLPDAYNVVLRIVDPLSNQGIKDVSVSACQGVDPGCALGGGLSSTGTTDDTGSVTLQLQSGFFGYFLIDAGPAYFPVIAYSSQPMYRVVTSFTLNIFQRSWLSVLATMLQSEVHSDASHIIFRAQNCLPVRFANATAATSAYASGVTVSYSRAGANSTRVFYTIGGLMVDPAASGTTLQGNGYGGAFNLPVGQTSIVGSHASMDVINAGLPLRADALGFLFLVPNARN
jgi:hypothetical protein